MLGHFALAGQLYTPWRSLHGAECEEQNIERSSAGSQQPEVERAGYRLQLCERCARRHGTGSKSGRVLDQNPAGGARVKEGRTIYLTVTTSKVPLVKLPDLIDNSSLRQAEAKLKAMGFKLTEPEYVSGEQDWIYGIKYRGRSLVSGDKVPHEAMLTLCVGNTAIRDSLAMDSTQITIDMNSSANSEAEVDDSWF